MKLKSFTLTTAALMGMLTMGSAYAQQPADNSAEEEEEEDIIETVVVLGVRSSLQKSLDMKRLTSAHTDVITSEDVMKFPDVNVAEALSRLPAVTVDRSSGGEGDKIAINGIDSRLVNVSLDGTPIATASTGANNTDTGRSFSFSNLAPELIGNVEVYKTTEARLDEGGIGGSVIVNTRNPLDTPANELVLNLNYNRNLRNDESDPRYSVFYNWKNASNTFGALFLYAYNKSVLGSGSLFAGYHDVCDASGWGGCDESGFTDSAMLPNVTSGPELAPGMLIPQYLANSSYEQQRERKTFHAVFEWRPVKDFSVKFSGLNVDSDFSSYSQTFFSDISVNWNEANAFDSRDPVTNEVLSPTMMTSVETTGAGVIGGTGAMAVRMDEYFKRQQLTNETYNLEIEWSPGDWNIRARGGTTEANGGSDPEYYLSFYGNQNGSWTWGPDGSNLALDVPVTDPGIFKTRASGQQAGFVKTAVTTDSIDYAYLDFTRNVNLGPFEEIQFGYKYHEHTDINQPHFFNTVFDITGSMSDFETFLSDRALVNGLSSSGDLVQYVAMTRDAVRAYSEGNKSAANVSTGDFRDASNFWNTTETANAYYIQGNFLSGRWSGDVGVRYVDTENEQTYRSTLDFEPWFEEMISTKSGYTDVLPSFNLIYNLTDDMLMRFSAGKVMSRPTFKDMSGQIAWNIERYGIDNEHFAGGGGNPDLEPYRAINYTATWEWYFAPNSIVNIDLLYKDIESYIVRKTSLVDVTVPTEALEYCAADTSLFCNGKLGRVTPMLINSPLNGSNAQVSGVAVGYIGDLGWGFGIQANATWLNQRYGSYTDDFNTAHDLPLPYLSKRSYSLSPFYEQGPISARLSYSWRSKYNTQVGSENDFPKFEEEWGQLDASFTYKWNDNLSLTLSAQNLLDDDVVPFTQGGLPLAWSKYGTRVTLGLRYRSGG